MNEQLDQAILKVQTINEQVADTISIIREKMWASQGLTEHEKEQERLMCILKAPVPTTSPLLDHIMSMRNSK